MADKLITAMTVSKNIHGYIALTRDTASSGANGHKMNAISSCIFARAVTASVLLSGVLKNSQDKLVLSWDCTGPAKKILVETGANGETRGFIEDRNLQLIERSIDGSDILSEPYIGFGELTVSRYSPNYPTPYHSVCVIETGEIANDIAIYLEQSLQVRSALNIGLQISKDQNIEICGGILLMAMPGATEEEIDEVFEKFKSIKSLTQMLKAASDNDDDFFNQILSTFNMEKISEKPIKFACHCDSNYVKNIISTLNDEQINEFKDADGNIKVTCQYCGKEYTF